MNAVLDIRELSLGVYHEGSISPVLLDIDLEVKAGQVHGLVGESGAGKSMLAKSILGILPDSAVIEGGSIKFSDVELIGLNKNRRRQFAGRYIAMIPQNPMTSLNPVRRVGRQISDVLRFHLNLNRQQAEKRSLELLNEVQIRSPSRVMRQYPFELSGGMRQRVLIAIAFSCNPELIIADEPTTALDVTVQRQILQLIKRLQAEFNTAVLFISHDIGVVAKICDVVSIIQNGAVVESESAATLFAEPRHPYTRSMLRGL